MRKIDVLSIAAGVVLAGAPAFAQDAPHGASPEGTTGGQRGTGATGTAGRTGGADLSQADRDFVMQAGQENLFEIHMGQLAETKSQNKSVKSLAKDLVKDHSKAQSNLQSIAQKMNVSVPQKMSDEQQSVYDRLNGMNPPQFDAAWLDEITKAHERSISTFQRHMDEGQNSQLKGFAKNTIGMLRKHENQARKDASKL